MKKVLLKSMISVICLGAVQVMSAMSITFEDVPAGKTRPLAVFEGRPYQQCATYIKEEMAKRDMAVVPTGVYVVSTAYQIVGIVQHVNNIRLNGSMNISTLLSLKDLFYRVKALHNTKISTSNSKCAEIQTDHVEITDKSH